MHEVGTCSCCSSPMLLSHWANMSRIWFSCFCCCCSRSDFCLFSSCWENCNGGERVPQGPGLGWAGLGALLSRPCPIRGTGIPHHSDCAPRCKSSP